MTISYSPSAITVITGLQEGRCLTNEIATTANVVLWNANVYQYAINTAPSIALGDKITSTRIQLNTLANKLWINGPVGFGVILGQVRSHIASAVEMKQASQFISNTSYDDFGSNVTSISSLATQGIDVLVGNVTAASNAVLAAGPCFDITDIKTFGTPAGFVKKLTQVKLANATGVNTALAKANVDLDNIEDPVYNDAIAKVLESIGNVSVISVVADQLGIPTTISGSQISFTNSGQTAVNLLDFTRINKLANPQSIIGLTADLRTIATQFNDLGARFKTVDEAANLLVSLSIPSLPNLDQFASNLTSMMGQLSANISATVGTGTGPLGVPSVTDFTHVITNGPELSHCDSNLNITWSNIHALSNAITNSTALFSSAGIDLDNQSSNFGFTIYKSVAQSMINIGENLVADGADVAVANIVTNDKYGEAVTSLLAEGRNQSVMRASGIQPPKFS